MSGVITRIVQPGTPMGLAPRGRAATPLALSFPNKNPGEVLDCAVDFTNELFGGADASLSVANVTVQGVGAATLPVTATAINGLLVTFKLGAGVPNSSYVVAITATTPSGRVVQAFVNVFVQNVPLPVNPAPIAAPAVPITDGLGNVITDSNGFPITNY